MKNCPALLATVLCGMVLAAAGCHGTRGPNAADDPPPVVTTATGVEMVLVRGGWFEMGCDNDEQPDQAAHKVYVDSFYMDRHPATQEEYERVIGKNPSRWKARTNPVEQVRWVQAAEFCNARSRLEGLQPAYDPETWKCHFEADGYRLPTEAEWECAARAGSVTTYFFGDTPAELKRYAWFKETGSHGPQPVAQKEPNPWGLYDMYGNVWQWCNDFYDEKYYRYGVQMNPRGPETGENRVVRGGCWRSPAEQCCSAYREYEMPAFTATCFGRDTSGFIGLRCVRSATSNLEP